MGHNLGMWHDCVVRGSGRVQFVCKHPKSKPRRMDGKDCYGYMDYDPKTNQWSHCNVADLTGVNKSCLKARGETCDNNGNCDDVIDYFSQLIIITFLYTHNIIATLMVQQDK